MVVFLHGGDQDARDFMDNIMQLPLWWAGGFAGVPTPQVKAIAIAPQGLSLTSDSAWNSGNIGNDNRLLEVDDTGFVLECLDRLEPILLDAYANHIQPYTGGANLTQVMDKNRLLLVGFSNGGQMAYRLVTEVGAAGWTVTALAVFGTSIGGWHREVDEGLGFAAAPPHGVKWTPSVIPSLLHLHGNLDPRIPSMVDGMSDDTVAAISAQVGMVALPDYGRRDISGQNSAAEYVTVANATAGWANLGAGAPPTTYPAGAAGVTAFTITDYDSTGGAVADHQVCFARVGGGLMHVVPPYAGTITVEFFQTWGGL